MTAALTNLRELTRPISAFAAFQSHFLSAFTAFGSGICAITFSFDRQSTVYRPDWLHCWIGQIGFAWGCLVLPVCMYVDVLELRSLANPPKNFRYNFPRVFLVEDN